MVSACFWRGRLCFGRGRLTTRDRGFVCLYTRVHTHKLLGYLMWAQVQDGHLESLKNPDRLKRSIHVDRIGVHSIFVCIYAGLRVLMIWATCLFSFNMSFLLRKEKMWRQSANHSHSPRSESKIAPWEFQTKLLHYFFTSNNKSNLHSKPDTFRWVLHV